MPTLGQGTQGMERGASEAAGRPETGAFLLVLALYWIGAVIGSRLTLEPGGVSIFWMPSAVLVAALVRYDGAGWWKFAALCVGAEVVADWHVLPVGPALVYGCANVLEATVTWGLLRSWRFDPRFASAVDTGRFVLAGPIAGALVGALAGHIALGLVSGVEGQPNTVFVWWFGDALGMLTVTPLYLAWSSAPDRRASPVLSRLSVDAAMGVCGLAVFLLLATDGAERLAGLQLRPSLLLPFVIYAAVRLPFRFVCLLMLVLGLALATLTVNGLPPYGRLEPEVAVSSMQEVVLVTSVVTLGLSSLLANLRSAEDDLRRANARLGVRAEALERRSRDLYEIAYAAAHDLRTPLRNIGSFVELIRQEHGPRMQPRVADWFQRVSENTRRLEGLLHALGDVTAIDAATAPFAWVDMSTVLDHVRVSLRPRLVAAQAELSRETLPIVWGDGDQFARLLAELVVESLAAGREGGIRVHVSASSNTSDWLFSVHHDGEGLPPGECERIFELFHRSRARARRGEADASNLALCARVVFRHGGRIWAESSPRTGCTFFFSIPREPQE